MNKEQRNQDTPNHCKQLRKYPLIQTMISTIIYQCAKSLHQDMPVYIATDNMNIIKGNQNYSGLPLDWWEKHLSSYFVTDIGLAVSCAWIKLNRPSGNDIFGCGKYYYNCRSGSFEIEIDSNGVLADIFGEFDCKTPSFIPELFVDFPKQTYLSKEELKDELSNNDLVDDSEFIDGLEPMQYKILEID